MSRADGFTLLECLVALAVLALAALALLRLMGFSAASAGDLDRRFAGELVARNVAIEALIAASPPTPGEATGIERNAGRAWRWTRRIGPAPDPALQAVAVAVTDDAGRPAGQLTLYRRRLP